MSDRAQFDRDWQRFLAQTPEMLAYGFEVDQLDDEPNQLQYEQPQTPSHAQLNTPPPPAMPTMLTPPPEPQIFMLPEPQLLVPPPEWQMLSASDPPLLLTPPERHYLMTPEPQLLLPQEQHLFVPDRQMLTTPEPPMIVLSPEPELFIPPLEPQMMMTPEKYLPEPPPNYQMPPPQPHLLMPPPQLLPPHQFMPPSNTMPIRPQPHQYVMTQSPYPINPRVSARELRNKAEKQRRDTLNKSIALLSEIVPPVVDSPRRVDKAGVLRLTAHYLRAHQHVFNNTDNEPPNHFSFTAMMVLLEVLNGFLLTVTYKGLVVLVSSNVQHYLGYTESDLIGQNILGITLEADHQTLLAQLMPPREMLGPFGELLVPEDAEGQNKLYDALAAEQRRFVIRLKRMAPKSEPPRYATCYVEGFLRKADRASPGYNKCCQMVRRARARSANPRSSGNDVVFVCMVRLSVETFMTESQMENTRLEYRTRHSVDGQIVQSEPRVSLCTGYMVEEVTRMNAMTFMHKDDVRWVICALGEMYSEHRLMGESCYRLLTKNHNFIYLKTRGRMELEENAKDVKTFTCTNTVVSEEDGIQLIALMKKKYSLPIEVDDPNKEIMADDIESPQVIAKEVLRLMQPLRVKPSGEYPRPPISFIPPNAEKTIEGINKMYNMVKIVNGPKERNVILQSVLKGEYTYNIKTTEGCTASDIIDAIIEPLKVRDIKVPVKKNDLTDEKILDKEDQTVFKASSVSKVIDQELKAQASGALPGTSTSSLMGVKRPIEDTDNDDNKKKVCEDEPPKSEDQPKDVAESVDEVYLHNFLEEADADMLTDALVFEKEPTQETELSDDLKDEVLEECFSNTEDQNPTG